MRYANEKIVEKLKKRYPEGCRVELVKMNDKQAPPIGTKNQRIGRENGNRKK